MLASLVQNRDINKAVSANTYIRKEEGGRRAVGKE